jgi:galactose mutarotase-like enzyme
VHSDERPFPASLGWHPWFRRRLSRGAPVEISFAAREMYVRDADGIPTGERVPPPPGPWDDCFTQVAEPPSLLWPGALRVTLEASVDHWVVYDEPEHAVCVEPQTGPPDALNLEPRIVAPERPLVATARLAWEPDPRR